MHIYTANNSVYFYDLGSPAYIQKTLPSGVTAINPATSDWDARRIRPCFASYKGKSYISGYFSRLLVVDQDRNLIAGGIASPTAAPTLAAGSAGGLTGSYIGFITFAHKLPNGVVVAESSPSAPTSAVTMSLKQRAWTNIQTTAVDSRVTHVRGWISMSGSIPRLCWERQLGVSSVTEEVTDAYLAGSETLPFNLTTGVPTYDADVPPYAKYIEIYHDRMWYAGCNKPNLLYYSREGAPEAVGALQYLETLDGEPITGIKRVGDQLMVFTYHSVYDVQGYGEEDFRVRKVQPSIGCISHHGIVNLHETLWFPSERGVFVYDGARFHFVMLDVRFKWRGDYKANIGEYQNSIGVEDPKELIYKLLIPKSTAYYWVASYEDFEGTNQPRWTIDRRARKDICAARLPTSLGGAVWDVYTGSVDGYVRRENVLENTDDDGDTDGKLTRVRTKHFFFGDAGGDKTEGKSLLRLWAYVQNEESSWDVYVYGGDETAADGAAAWSATEPASFSEGYVAKTRHVFVVDKASGHGFSFQFESSGTNEWIFRGFGGLLGPGPGRRPSTT